MRYVPLDDAGDIWITIGGEYRLRVESFDNPDFGVTTPDYTSATQRVLLNVDLRTENGPRAFVELSAADEDGRKPGPRTADVSRPDIAQAFVDLPIRLGDTTVQVRAGRQEMTLSGNRLLSPRNATPLRRAFEGVRVDATHGQARLTAFHLRPVLNQPNGFDDGTVPGEVFAGASLDMKTNRSGTWTVFAFHRERSFARTALASGPEQRLTVGVLYAPAPGPTEFTFQGGVQTGELGGRTVRAWGATAEIGWKLGENGRVGLLAGAASGDDATTDTVETFDPLYPSLGAFTEAPLYSYLNQINVQVNASRDFGPVAVKIDATWLGRASIDDAIYTSTGQPLATASRARASGALFEATARWRPHRYVEVFAAFIYARALDAVRESGGHDATYGFVHLTSRF